MEVYHPKSMENKRAVFEWCLTIFGLVGPFYAFQQIVERERLLAGLSAIGQSKRIPSDVVTLVQIADTMQD